MGADVLLSQGIGDHFGVEDVFWLDGRAVGGGRIVEGVALILGYHLGALLPRGARHVQVAVHLHAGDEHGIGRQGAVENRVHGIGGDVGQGQHVGRFAVRLHCDHVHDAAGDLHVGRRQAVNPLTRDGGIGFEQPSKLVGHVLVENAGALDKVLGHGDKTVNVAAGVQAGVFVGLDRCLVHQLFVRHLGRERAEAGVADAHDRYIFGHALPPLEGLVVNFK